MNLFRYVTTLPLTQSFHIHLHHSHSIPPHGITPPIVEFGLLCSLCVVLRPHKHFPTNSDMWYVPVYLCGLRFHSRTWELQSRCVWGNSERWDDTSEMVNFSMRLNIFIKKGNTAILEIVTYQYHDKKVYAIYERICTKDEYMLQYLHMLEWTNELRYSVKMVNWKIIFIFGLELFRPYIGCPAVIWIEIICFRIGVILMLFEFFYVLYMNVKTWQGLRI